MPRPIDITIPEFMTAAHEQGELMARPRTAHHVEKTTAAEIDYSFDQWLDLYVKYYWTNIQFDVTEHANSARRQFHLGFKSVLGVYDVVVKEDRGYKVLRVFTVHGTNAIGRLVRRLTSDNAVRIRVLTVQKAKVK